MEIVRYIYEHWFKTLLFVVVGGWSIAWTLGALTDPLRRSTKAKRKAGPT